MMGKLTEAFLKEIRKNRIGVYIDETKTPTVCYVGVVIFRLPSGSNRRFSAMKQRVTKAMRREFGEDIVP